MNRYYTVYDVFKEYKVNQLFGMTDFAIKMKKRYEEEGKKLYKYFIHTGIDLSMRIGTPVRCPLNGIVVVDDDANNSGRGIAVSIWDKKQLLAFRAYHLRENFVYENQEIKACQSIGFSGKTAGKFNFKPHLHYEFVTTDKYGKATGKYNGAIDPKGKNILLLDMIA